MAPSGRAVPPKGLKIGGVQFKLLQFKHLPFRITDRTFWMGMTIDVSMGSQSDYLWPATF
jgi:hypothetical protein